MFGGLFNRKQDGSSGADLRVNAIDASTETTEAEPSCAVEIVSSEDQYFSDIYGADRFVARCEGCGLESDARTSEDKARADLAAKCAARELDQAN